MPWPGSPKSASSPPINLPSVRFPHTLNENSTMGEVADAVRTAFNGLAVHEQAFANIPSQISTQAAAAATTAVEQFESVTTSAVTSFNTLTGAILFFPGLGTVNNQLGQSSYSVAQSDAGAKIIVGDSSTVSVNFGAGISAPWFAIIDNDSSSVANLIATSGAMFGAQSVDSGAFGIVFYDGANWWAGASSGGGSAPFTPLGGPTTGRPAAPPLYSTYFDTTIGYPVWFTDSGATGYTNALGMPA